MPGITAGIGMVVGVTGICVVGVAGICVVGVLGRSVTEVLGIGVAGVLERGVVVLEVTGVDQCVRRCSKRILCM